MATLNVPFYKGRTTSLSSSEEGHYGRERSPGASIASPDPAGSGHDGVKGPVLLQARHRTHIQELVLPQEDDSHIGERGDLGMPICKVGKAMSQGQEERART